MAVVKGTFSKPGSAQHLPRAKKTWANLTTANSSGDAFNAIDLPDKSVSVTGTFGASASISLQNADGNRYKDPQGNVIAITSAGVSYIAENFSDIHPVLSNGDGSTDLTVVVEATNPARSIN